MEAQEAQIEFSPEWMDFGEAEETERSYTKKLSFKNTGKKDLILRLTQVKYEQAPSAAYQMGEHWLIFKDGAQRINLAVDTKLTVAIRAFPDKEAPLNQSFYGAIKVELLDAKDEKTVLSTRLVPVKIDLKGEGWQKGGELGVSQMPIRVGDGLASRVKIKNKAKVGFPVSYQAKLKNQQGEWQTQGELVTRELMPEAEIEFTNDDKIGYGLKDIAQEITYVGVDGKTHRVSYQQKILNLPVVAVALMAALIVISAGVSWWLLKKRRKAPKKNLDY